MFEKTVERYRFINRHGPAEDSIPFRAAVLATVVTSVASAAHFGEIGAPTGGIVALICVGASIFSYFARERDNLLVKLVMSVLLLALFARFWGELFTSLNDVRYPLVTLFLWLQAIHSFDLPTRRDLDFSLLSATVLMAFSGSMAISTDFLAVLVFFFLLLLVSLHLGHRSLFSGEELVRAEGAPAGIWAGAPKRPRVRILVPVVLLLPLTVALFAFLPRTTGFNAFYLPYTDSGRLPTNISGLLRNPGYADTSAFPATPLPYDPDSYAAFSRFMDLRQRGKPGEKQVMKVRSARAAYWRSTAFDYFRGNGWENTDGVEETVDLTSDEMPISVSYPEEFEGYATETLVQTFYVGSRLPNCVFGAATVRDLFFPTQVVRVDSQGTVLVPNELTPGLVYTVISQVVNATPQQLRMTRQYTSPAKVRERYCQLPEISSRVRELAEQVTAGLDNNYDRVVALERHLEENYGYSYEFMQQEDDQNSVEFFLFEEKVGVCEQFSSALAVMCRSIDVPARVAVGYSAGEYNSLTGYYEVSGSDAHAWTEVFFPMFGWIPFDPTPGSTIPVGNAMSGSRWSGMGVFSEIKGLYERVVPKGVRGVLGGIFGAIGDGVTAAFEGVAWFFANLWWTLVAAVAVFFFVRWVRRRVLPAGELTGLRRRPPDAVDTRGRAFAVFQRLEQRLSAFGITRCPSETALEFAARADRKLDPVDGVVRDAASIFTRIRFSREPRPEELSELEKSASRAEKLLSSDVKLTRSFED